MKMVIGLVSAGFLVLLNPHAHAGSTTAARQMENLISLSGVQPNTRRGQQFFTTQQGREWSCASYHTVDPTAAGQDIKTGNVIQPMAPSANPDRFTDAAKTEKWFRNNCSIVIGRECTPEEKSNVLAWLLSLKR